MPVNYHGRQPVNLPRDLRSATHVFVRIDAVRPPLSRPYQGPFPVISRDPDLKTFTVDRAGKPWVVSVDRLKPAFYLVDSAPGMAAASSSRDLDLDLDLDLDSDGPDAEVGQAALPTAQGDNVFPLRDPAPVEDLVARAAPLSPVLPAAAVVPAAAEPVPELAPAIFTRSGRASRPPERFQAGV